jgi:hypothetical protein
MGCTDIQGGSVADMKGFMELAAIPDFILAKLGEVRDRKAFEPVATG